MILKRIEVQCGEEWLYQHLDVCSLYSSDSCTNLSIYPNLLGSTFFWFLQGTVMSKAMKYITLTCMQMHAHSFTVSESLSAIVYHLRYWETSVLLISIYKRVKLSKFWEFHNLYASEQACRGYLVNLHSCISRGMLVCESVNAWSCFLTPAFHYRHTTLMLIKFHESNWK